MCGVTGVSLKNDLSFEYKGNFNAERRTKESIKAINHRGPDDSGIYSNNNGTIWLGHTRLSILDLSKNGHQPMVSECKSYAISFNGEIYNFKELRKDLISKGYFFKSNSDTEVILNLYIHSGEKMFSSLNGIFSIAIWDKNKNIILLSRDGIGVKPLYYYEEENFVSFCSEIKGLIPFFNKKMSLHIQSIFNYLSFFWNPSSRMPLEKVKKVLPGEAIKISDGKIKEKYLWYKLPQPTKKKKFISRISLNKKLTEKIRKSVHSQMISDAPLGAFLSGGLDSSSVVAFAREINPEIQCFTYNSGGNERGMTDDLPYAIQTAKHLKVPLEIINIDSSTLCEDFESMVIQLDEPLADPAALNVKLICHAARKKGIKVLLSGAGGDDIFTGYRRHKAIKLQSIINLFPNKGLKYLEKKSMNLDSNYPFFRRLSKFLNGSYLDGDERIINFFKWNRIEDLRSILSKDFKKYLEEKALNKEFINFLENYSSNLNDIDKMLLLEQKFFLPDLNLLYTDKMSMAEGVETRVPLLDPNLIDFVSKIHNSKKQSFTQGKKIFKKIMEPFLPKKIIYRPKSGFGAPIRDWIKNDFQDLISTHLNRASIEKRGLFDSKAVLNLIKRNRKGEVDASYLILCMISIEIWSRFYLDENKNKNNY